MNIPLWIFGISGFAHLGITIFIAFRNGVMVFHLPDHIRRARSGNLLSKLALLNYAVFVVAGIVVVAIKYAHRF